MRHSNGQRLSDVQVGRLEARRKLLGLTRTALLRKFEDALRKDGCIHTEAAAKMRLDRVFNPRLRRPMSEETKAALAAALDWSIPKIENVLHDGVSAEHENRDRRAVLVKVIPRVGRDLADIAQRLQSIAQTLQVSSQPSRTRRRLRV